MILETILIIIIGTIFHFTYDISKHNKVVGLFSAVNESTWEHIKIGLTATFILTLVDGYIYGTNPNYFIAKSLSLIIIILLIPVIFYTYTQFTKKPILAVDIMSFIITIICSQLIFRSVLNIDKLPFIYNYIGLIIMFIIFGSYMVLTILPIKSFIFKDPITNKYGIKGHNHEEHHHH